jgi:hypothetical protein
MITQRLRATKLDFTQSLLGPGTLTIGTKDSFETNKKKKKKKKKSFSAAQMPSGQNNGFYRSYATRSGHAPGSPRCQIRRPRLRSWRPAG